MHTYFLTNKNCNRNENRYYLFQQYFKAKLGGALRVGVESFVMKMVRVHHYSHWRRTGVFWNCNYCKSSSLLSKRMSWLFCYNASDQRPKPQSKTRDGHYRCLPTISATKNSGELFISKQPVGKATRENTETNRRKEQRASPRASCPAFPSLHPTRHYRCA